jgi:predicted permease
VPLKLYVSILSLAFGILATLLGALLVVMGFLSFAGNYRSLFSRFIIGSPVFIIVAGGGFLLIRGGVRNCLTAWKAIQDRE